MSKNLYDVLGVKKDASGDEIRSAYRKLAKELHPDLNPDHKAAEEKFKSVSAAYNILRDEEKRAKYDRGEIDESGAEKPEYAYYRQYADSDAANPYHYTTSAENYEDFSDIFSDLFSRRRQAGGSTVRMRGADVRYHLKIDFLEAAKGAKKRITMPDGATLNVTIPRGIDDGQTIRLKGKGAPGINDGPAGDALIEIEVAPHAYFDRDGLNVLLELPITIDEAILGAEVAVPTITGTVKMKIPKGASSGQTLRLKGKGIHYRGEKHQGDQLVKLKIVLPDKIDSDLEEAIKVWKTEHSYDPRRKFGVKA